MEALRRLGEAGDEVTARKLLLGLIRDENCRLDDKATGAFVLHQLGFIAEARSILFDIRAAENLSHVAALWTADIMLECGLASTAASTLASINAAALDAHEKEWFIQIEKRIRFAAFEQS